MTNDSDSDDFPDYYASLGVRRDAAPKEIRDCFRREVSFWHPDRFVGRDEGSKRRAERTTARLTTAWAVLRDPSKRAAYDRLLAEWQQVNQRLAIVVSASGDGNFQTIAEAISVAKVGGLILVRSGTYRENLDIDRDISIWGIGPDAPLVLGDAAPCLSIECQQATIRGVRFELSEQAVAGDSPLGTIPEQPVLGDRKAVVLAAYGKIALEDCQILSADVTPCLSITGRMADVTLRNCKLEAFSAAVIATRESSATCERLTVTGKTGVVIDRGATVGLDSCKLEVSEIGLDIRANGKLAAQHCRVKAGANAIETSGSNCSLTITDCELIGVVGLAVEEQDASGQDNRINVVGCKIEGASWAAVRIDAVSECAITSTVVNSVVDFAGWSDHVLIEDCNFGGLLCSSWFETFAIRKCRIPWVSGKGVLIEDCDIDVITR